jgi:hypothetical protein
MVCACSRHRVRTFYRPGTPSRARADGRGPTRQKTEKKKRQHGAAYILHRTPGLRRPVWALTEVVAAEGASLSRAGVREREPAVAVTGELERRPAGGAALDATGEDRQRDLCTRRRVVRRTRARRACRSKEGLKRKKGRGPNVRTSIFLSRSSGSGSARSCVLRVESDVLRMLLYGAGAGACISNGSWSKGGAAGGNAREILRGALVVVQPAHDARRGDLMGGTHRT